jgi:hypothetical protein
VVAAPQPHVLVAPPTTIFVTLQVHLRATKEYPRVQENEREACLAAAKNTAEEEACFE